MSTIDSNIPPNKVEDFKENSIPSIPKEESASDEKPENYEGIVGMLVMPIEKVNKNKTNSKEIRRR